MKPRPVVALATDAWGGRGGIALYNRHFQRAVCSYPGFSHCEVFPRSIFYALEEMPPNLMFHAETAAGLPAYVAGVLKRTFQGESPAVVFCSHLHLLPLAAIMASVARCPLLPLTYGVEAWTPSRHASSNMLAKHLKDFISIRKYTASRFRSWTGNTKARFHYLPNCIEMAMYGVGPKRADLLARYELEGRTTIMTAGRMESSQAEIRKGFEEVIEALPLLVRKRPDIAYLIMGDGDDRSRLQDIARSCGVEDRVRFTGYVSEADKADHYRLADVVAMPGSNPSFDTYPFRFGFLEPLACGVPVVGARLTDPSEVDDTDAKDLIVQVDPTDAACIADGILAALSMRTGRVHPRLNRFSYETFETEAHKIFDKVTKS